MKTKINLKEFFQFLMDNKILHPYMRYLKTNKDWRKSYFIVGNENIFLKTYIAEISSRECIIQNAFPWDETHEGYIFWEKINDKWRKYMENNGKCRK